MTARRLADMSQPDRRRAITRTLVAITFAWVALVGAYYALPVGPGTPALVGARIVVCLALLTLVLAVQARHIARARIPELRAAVALGAFVPLFLVMFSSIYLAMSEGSATIFTEELDHTRALYFTITVFATVGFGDITPTTDGARAVVSLQMILDLIIIGVVVRVLFTAAQAGLRQSRPERDHT